MERILTYKYHYIFHISFFIWITNCTYGQTDFVVIDSVHISGLKKTKSVVVTQEIDLHPGDTISLKMLAGRLLINEKRLLSIGIFTLASINIKNWNTELNTCNINIKVQENWYIYPYLIFELADRNFNVWRKEFNYSLKRVNFGAALNHINFTGHKDKLKIKLQGGYIRKFELAYDYPYLWNKWGLSTNVLYTENREISYKTVSNKPVFYRSDDNKKVFFQHRASISLLHRANALHFQTLRLEYINATTDTFISGTLNPDFFGTRSNKIRYFLIDILARYDNTVYPLYPLGGHKLELNIRKEGLGIFNDVDNLWISASAEQHTPVLKNLIISNKIKFKIQTLHNSLPYFLNNALGYGENNITGYQLYVMDGRNFILSRNTLRYRILDKDFKTIKYAPNQFKIMNAKLFIRFNFDVGFSDDPVFNAENPLTNHWQHGYGPGVDVILFNNFTVSAEYGITKFGESGFFFESGFNF